MMLLALVVAACLPVNGPHITAKDVAAAVPGFAPQDPAASFGYSPTPGVQRIVHPAELQQFLKRQGFEGEMPLNEVCFARPTALLTEAMVTQAMQDTLGKDAHIEVVELSHFPAPIGKVVFSREDIGTPPIALWHGYVTYDVDKRFPVWARVKVSVQATRVMATEELRSGIPIKASQIALQTVDEFPSHRASPTSISKVEGATPRHFIAANSPVYLDSIDPPNDITKGDRVSVLVHSGHAQLAFDAEAEASGRLGDLVSFKNPDSGKLFRARVEGPGRATVDTPSVNP
jgi:flagella basal body P-ring formation protein FlgA